jgi:ABC-type Mn2+/Zn2+ transport system permease subunit
MNLALALLAAVASGLVGSIAIMRRMALAGDAFSHVALPGVGLALAYSVNPMLGGAAALILGALIIWKVEKVTTLNVEAMIGVLFSISLAIGAIAIGEEHELIKMLFGGVRPAAPGEFIIGIMVAVFIIAFILYNRRALTLMLVSRELAKTAAIKTEKMQLLFLLVFALTVLLGMKFLGVLLTGSLIIIPASSARNVAKNLHGMLALSSGAALISMIAGLMAVRYLDLNLGPAAVIVAGILFVLTLIINLAGQKRFD